MKNLWLLNAIGDVDAELVQRAGKTPLRRLGAIRWISAAAAAVVLVVGVGVYFATLDGGETPPVAGPDSTTTTTTIGEGDGTGGDNWSCPVHSELFHRVDGELHDYVEALVGEEPLVAYFQAQDAITKQTFNRDTTYPYDECYVPGSGGLPGFLKDFGITRDQFIEAMGWGDYLDHVYQDFYPYDDDGHYYLFTYRDVVDALYGDDPHLTAWVFHNTASYADEFKYQDFYYDDWVLYKRNCDPLWEYIYENYAGITHTNEAISHFKAVCRELEDEEADNVFHLVQFFNIDRQTLIELYGWTDKLDEKATEHFPYAPYTYRQFVDAVYGEDTTLRRWVFNQWVFHPDYPTLEEFASLTEGDRYYCAPFTVTPLEPVEKEEACVDHNPMYHDLSNFNRKYVAQFRSAYAYKDKEELNVVNFAKYLKSIQLTYNFAGYYDFSLIKDRDKIAVDHGEGCPYTYGQFYYAVFGSDAALTEWVFAPTSTWPKAEQWPPEGEWPPQGYGYEKKVTCTEHPLAYHDLSYFPANLVEEYKASIPSGNEEDYNLFDFINYYGLDRINVSYALGFNDELSKALDETDTMHSENGTYTYRQFLDAIFGDDPELTARVFGTGIASVTTTTTRDPNWGRDENGNTTLRTTTTATQP